MLIALVLWIPATFASACDACGEFAGTQVIARAMIALAPMWLLLIAIVSVRFRAAVVLLAAVSGVMAVVTFVLGTDARSALSSVGLSSAMGFSAYSIPFAIVAVAAIWDLGRAATGDPTEGGER